MANNEPNLFMRLLLLAVLALSLSACQILYRLPTRQGNVIDQRDLNKLQIGMTREQVKFVMGTPVAANPFRDERWDYFGYYKSPRGQSTSRTVSLYFADNKLSRMEGVQQASTEDLSAPDMQAIQTDFKKEANDSRTIPPPPSDQQSPIPGGTP